MDRGRCLDILRNAGVGPKTIRILKAFWDKADLACRASAATIGGSSRLGER